MSPARRHRPDIATVGPTAVISGLGRRPIIAAVAAGLFAVGTVACGDLPAIPTRTPSPVAPHTGTATVAPPAVVAAPTPQPVADGPCHYLPTAAVQAANGERVTAVRVSADRPHPACFFLTYNAAVQLRTWIVTATPEVARATVDAAVPVATSDLAELAGGWSGGSQPTAEGAVFAVARQGTAVVITTNQRQTIGARQIAEQVIAALHL